MLSRELASLLLPAPLEDRVNHESRLPQPSANRTGSPDGVNHESHLTRLSTNHIGGSDISVKVKTSHRFLESFCISNHHLITMASTTVGIVFLLLTTHLTSSLPLNTPLLPSYDYISKGSLLHN